MALPDWQWNEIQQVERTKPICGKWKNTTVAWANSATWTGENREMLAMLNLPRGAAVLEIGCGTGPSFARPPRRQALEQRPSTFQSSCWITSRKKAADEGLPAIATQHAGFLTMVFPGRIRSTRSCPSGPCTICPDAWKLVALRNIARVLKPGGQFILRDVVFSLKDGRPPEACFEAFASSVPTMRLETARHVAREYSTYDWIMEGLLERAGLEIIARIDHGESFIIYHCRTGRA
jgi:SAM-dependent methyltransferase